MSDEYRSVAADAIVWPPAPERPRLDHDEVHVWAARLDVVPEVLAGLAATLSDEERERAGRFRFARLRERYTAGRGLLRWLLGRYLDIGPAEVELVYSSDGKPALAPRSSGAGIHFNLSHSENLALFAFTRAGAVGVDVERIRPMKGAKDLVARFFSRRESELFQKLAEDQQPAAFFNLWTRKEALLKATGKGITGGLHELEVTFLPGEPARLLAMSRNSERAARWTLRELSPADSFVGAVAVEALDVNLQCWKHVSALPDF